MAGASGQPLGAGRRDGQPEKPCRGQNEALSKQVKEDEAHHEEKVQLLVHPLELVLELKEGAEHHEDGEREDEEEEHRLVEEQRRDLP
eukprot:CAMPEP_0169477852 /NCGR_PEP_ID=MMETSP1042-20121227/28153_1 /TAXON_ID=464988 /ORGANISM="Hemiselmis andersenii, Strain CCMP1180" /LENGTH=87 /DNA_ID=CAMNT_0009592261 /DNA_START=69 /DNA_END=332 /DNA_ORIENTATION=+